MRLKDNALLLLLVMGSSLAADYSIAPYNSSTDRQKVESLIVNEHAKQNTECFSAIFYVINHKEAITFVLHEESNIGGLVSFYKNHGRIFIVGFNRDLLHHAIEYMKNMGLHHISYDDEIYGKDLAAYGFKESDHNYWANSKKYHYLEV